MNSWYVVSLKLGHRDVYYVGFEGGLLSRRYIKLAFEMSDAACTADHRKALELSRRLNGSVHTVGRPTRAVF